MVKYHVVLNGYFSMIKKSKEQKSTSRRQFLKKTAYTAPSLLILGQLLNPTPISADFEGSTPGGPLGKIPVQANKRVKP